jgi:hypothetical protein
LKRSFLAKLVIICADVCFVIGFFYWILYDHVILNHASTYLNYMGFAASMSVFFLIAVSFKSSRSSSLWNQSTKPHAPMKVARETPILLVSNPEEIKPAMIDKNPWEMPIDHPKEPDKTSFPYYVKGLVRDFEARTSRDFGVLGRKKYHMRFLRQTKRVTATGLFFLYLALGFASFPNPLSLLFFVTGFLELDYLWKSRRASFERTQT